MDNIIKTENLVIGSGAAGLNAACLLSNNSSSLILATEGLKCGTSLNTGSDKQTYYKLTLSGDEKDSVREMANDLFKGGSLDGDNALIEASLSSESFFRLVSLGVPFPRNRWGEYIGYKTDHDMHQRATSAGPYTSKFMTEALLKEAENKGINILDGIQLIKLITKDNIIKGALFVDRKTGNLKVIEASYVVLATGGPAGIYKNSVYPESQFGATGIAYEAGCKLQNVTEWQYGLSSVKPRWNVSGSYMQVLPRFVSIDKDGNEYEFIFDYDKSEYELLSYIFLKGYQWPFDVRKLENGSSIIDILVFLELEKGRKVYLDFTKNRFNKLIEFEKLSKEAYAYLKSANALGLTPIERLKKLNKPAYEFYLDKGIDLEKEYLEISLSSQHNNGGISVDLWWESSIKNLFVVGEAAGTHGVYRPGGSALNAGQVGSKRASQMISKRNKEKIEKNGIDFTSYVKKEDEFINNALKMPNNVRAYYDDLKALMSLSASVLREEKALEEAYAKINSINLNEVGIKDKSSAWLLYEYKNALITSKAFLKGMLTYLQNNGESRGSAIYSLKNGEVHPKGLDERFRYKLEKEVSKNIIEVFNDKDEIKTLVRNVREIPSEDNFFENVWSEFRENGNIY